MERRREPRLQIEMPATLTRLDMEACPLAAVILNVSAVGVGLRTTCAIPPHTPVRLDWNGGLLLGEVVHIDGEDSAFVLGVSIRHSLNNLAAISAACEAFAAQCAAELDIPR